MKKMMLILLMLMVAAAAFAGPLALDDFNSYSAGANLLSQPSWSQLFASDDPLVDAGEVYAGMGNSVVGLNENIYAGAKYALASGLVDITAQTVYVTGLMQVNTKSASTVDDGLYMGFANSNSSKVEIRFLEGKDVVVVNTTSGGYSTFTYDTADLNKFEAGKTYICVAKLTPVEGSATSVTLDAGFAEFNGYPLGDTEMTYQVAGKTLNVTDHTSFSNVIFFPRGVGHNIDHMFAGETWDDVKDPQPYVPPVYGPLIGYWPMDEGKGQVAPDKSDYGNDAVTTGSGHIWGYGKVAAGAELKGSVFNVSSIEQLSGATALTISGWFKPTATDTGYRGAFATRGINDNSGSGQNWGIAFDNDHFESRTSGAAVDSALIPVVGQWYHVVQVWDGQEKTTTLYINGKKDTGPVSHPDVSSIISCTSWPIGEDQNRKFAGMVDELAIWNIAYEPNDVNDLYWDGIGGIGADGSIAQMPDEIPPLNWIDPFTYRAPDVIFSKDAGLGNGGFEDLFEYVHDHPQYTELDQPYNEPFRIACEGLGSEDIDPAVFPNADWCSIDDGRWTARVTNQGYEENMACWETAMYSDPPGYAKRSYEGETHFVVQHTQTVELVSDYGVDATAIEEGENLTIEWYSYVIPHHSGAPNVNITASLIFDKGLPTEREAVAGTLKAVEGEYVRRGVDYAMVGTAATVDVKLVMASASGQLRIDNVQVTKSPLYVLNEDAPGNVANVPVVLLEDPGKPVTLTVSTWSDEKSYIKYTTEDVKWTLMDDITVSELTFDSSNWDIEQDLVITSIGNDTIDGDRRMTFSISEPNIVPSLEYFNVDIIDNEFPRIAVGDDDVVVGEKGVGPGASDKFTVSLGGVSASEVQINLVDNNDPVDVTIDPVSLVFTPAEIAAGTPKLVTVTAVDDGTAESVEHETSIGISAAAVEDDPAPDMDYIEEFPAETVIVKVLDADCGSEGHEVVILDVTGDCVVDIADFAELASRWMECYAPNLPGCIAVH